jgi:cell shape-determining protein MreD
MEGFATISLDLFYHSMALSQPPSRDTVPLIYTDFLLLLLAPQIHHFAFSATLFEQLAKYTTSLERFVNKLLINVLFALLRQCS